MLIEQLITILVIIILGLLWVIGYWNYKEKAIKFANKQEVEISNIQHQIELKNLKDKLQQVQDQATEYNQELSQVRLANVDIVSKKKSSETRLGMISEHLIPMLASFPYDPQDAHFLGQPVDYIIYNLDQGEIVFLEVKSGNSKLSKRQKIVKNIIEQGRVRWEELRINEEGINIKKKVEG